jgi:glutathione reductase (NADPH)
MNHFDVAIVGSGTAAQTFVSSVDTKGRSVALIEAGQFGGVCALKGCQPKKYLVANAEAVAGARHLKGKGLRGEIRTDWPALMALKGDFTDGVSDGTFRHLSETLTEVIRGRAQFKGPQTLDVEGREIAAGQIVLATGSRPRRAGIPGAELAITSDDFLRLPELPESVLFIGGGYIAMEFAHVARYAGAKVTVLNRGQRILKGFDPSCVDVLVEASRTAGIDIVPGAEAGSIRATDSGLLEVTTTSGDTYRAAAVVEASGRLPNVESLNLEAGDVAYGPEGITVGNDMRSTSNPQVFALGDVVMDGPDLATIADLQAKYAARQVEGDSSALINYQAVPSTAFTIPNIASVGLQEAQARERGHDFRVNEGTTTRWPSSRRIGEEHSLYRVLIDNPTGRILGAHLTRHAAGETINLFALAIRHEVPVEALLDIPWAYPTYGSDFKYMIG